MNSIAPILLRCILAVTLVTGGASIGSASAMAVKMDSSSQAQSDTLDHHGSDCLPADGDIATESPAAMRGDDCCGEQEGDCTHEKCDCVCPASTIIVPARSAPTAPTVAKAPFSALASPAPQKVITTLLRPPRA